MRVAVTGAAGFIGGETVLKLIDRGHEVLAIDRNPLPSHLLPWFGFGFNHFEQTDLASDQCLDALDQWEAQCVIHCGGISLVGPSMSHPRLYYQDNFVKTKTLVDGLVARNVRMIFSSSAAVYGEPVITPCSEFDPVLPMSPYGQSKAMIEWMLDSYAKAYGLNYVAFRYFNACGADSQTRHGQEPDATHLVARLLESLRHDRVFQLNGDSYPTLDGTCVRDYVHVEDIAAAHVMAMEDQSCKGVYNLGTGQGHSNKQVIDAVQRVLGHNLKIQLAQPRPGDPAQLTADAAKFSKATGWQPQYDLDAIIKHAWLWYTQ